MLTPADENSLLMDIKEGIQYALYVGKQEGRFTEDEIRLDQIRLNKLQYIASEDLGLGLTFGWFKYGPAPNDVATADGSADLTPHSEEEIDYLEESRLPSKDYRTREAFAYYFLRDLGNEFDEIVTAEDTKVYLEDFYAEYAPKDEYAARFKDLYVASARLQQALDPIGEGREWHDQATDYYYNIDRKFIPVGEELSKHEALAHTREPLKEYRRLLTSIISEAAAQDEISTAQQSFINNAVRKFYNTIWDYIAQEISLQTMRGENVDELRPAVEATVSNYRDGSWRDELGTLTDRSSTLGLEPDFDDIEKINSGRNEEDDFQSLDSELVEQVSQMGAEVISE